MQKVFEREMREKLRRREEKEREMGKEGGMGERDFRMCAPHDLAPVFERAFGIQYTKLNKSKHFKELLRNQGLELREGVRFKGV